MGPKPARGGIAGPPVQEASPKAPSPISDAMICLREGRGMGWAVSQNLSASEERRQERNVPKNAGAIEGRTFPGGGTHDNIEQLSGSGSNRATIRAPYAFV